jgi:hypothetical protein
MTLDDPIDFKAVYEKIAAKVPVTTQLKSWQIARIPVAVRDRALFSAQTMSAELLSGYHDRLKQMSQENEATMRAKMKDLIAELDITAPSEDEAGSITDLGSNSRIGLVLRTNMEMARGWGQYVEGMTEGALQAFPALELIRVEDRQVPREWFDIWDDAADELGDETTATSAEETGRMVAKKGDPIWLAISDFGLPYPPFKFSSGMGVEDVDYQDAVDLGVIDEDEIPQQGETLDFNHGVESSIAEMAPEIVKVLGEGLEGIATKVGNVFQMIAPKPSAPAPKLENEAQQIRNRASRVLSLLEEAA